MLRPLLLLPVLVVVALSLECFPGQIRSSDGHRCFSVVPVLASSRNARDACVHSGGSPVSLGNGDLQLILAQINARNLESQQFWFGNRCDFIDGRTQTVTRAPCKTLAFSICQNSGGEFPSLSECTQCASSSTAAPPTAPSVDCPAGWDLHEGSCYFVRTERMDQRKADAFCRSNDADLISIHSAAENEFVSHLFVLKGGVDGFWIGAVRDAGAFAWSDKSPFDYTNWGIQQPDDRNSCVRLSLYSKTWLSAYCEQLAPQVLCKKPLVPKPPTTCPDECRVQPPLTTSAPRPSKCLAGWRRFRDSCYFVNANEMKWMAAKSFCESKNAHLTSIHSAEENAFVADLLSANGIWHFTWIGGIRNSTAAGFRWTDGSNWDFSHWLNAKQLNRVGPVEYFPAATTWSIPILGLQESISPSVCKQNLRK